MAHEDREIAQVPVVRNAMLVTFRVLISARISTDRLQASHIIAIGYRGNTRKTNVEDGVMRSVVVVQVSARAGFMIQTQDRNGKPFRAMRRKVVGSSGATAMPHYQILAQGVLQKRVRIHGI